MLAQPSSQAIFYGLRMAVKNGPSSDMSSA
jgi:hypothetical protein